MSMQNVGIFKNICEISKNNFFTKHLWATASVLNMILKSVSLPNGFSLPNFFIAIIKLLLYNYYYHRYYYYLLIILLLLLSLLLL